MFAIQGMCAHKVEPLQRHECTHTRHDTQLSLNAIKEGRNLVVFNENASNKLKTNIKINNILFFVEMPPRIDNQRKIWGKSNGNMSSAPSVSLHFTRKLRRLCGYRFVCLCVYTPTKLGPSKNETRQPAKSIR